MVAFLQKQPRTRTIFYKLQLNCVTYRNVEVAANT